MAKAIHQKVKKEENGVVAVAEQEQKKYLATSIWERDWADLMYFLTVVSVHMLCLFAPFTFTWGRLQMAVVRYITSGLLGITLCYHRGLSHGSFKLPKFLEYLFAYIGLHAIQGDPIFWVSAHRYHHKFTDTNRDPHSPTEGFWFSHIIWIFDNNYLCRKAGKFENVQDLTSQRYYRFLHDTLVLHVLSLAGFLYMIGGFPFLVWGIGVPVTCAYHATFCVNSVCHTWGTQAWNTKDLSRNNWVIALVTFGEGWHNNHHAFEFSARQGLDLWQIDATWYVISFLKSLGLATNVKVPTEVQKKKMSFKNGMEEKKLSLD